MLNKFILTALFILLNVAIIAAHPLGNFSVNNYSRLTIEKKAVLLHCVLDLAEIPTFQESQKIDANRDGLLDDAELNIYLDQITPRYISNLQLLINNQPLELRVLNRDVSLVTGAGNLKTLRLIWELQADHELGEQENSRLAFSNKNYPERVGWNEIVVNRASGINVFDSNVYGNGLTDELKNYPEELLGAPLSERAAEFSYSTSAVPVGSQVLQNRNGGASTPVQKDKFAQLIAVTEITPSIALFGILLAAGFGALHAMSPGHGKTVVGAYLVGSRGTAKHAAFLGLTVTVTHTIGVFLLGLITLFASNFILPERLMPLLSFVSGLMVVYIGLSLFKSRLFSYLGWNSVNDSHQHTHDSELSSHTKTEEIELSAANGFTHTHDGQTHSHLPPPQVSWKSLLALGISGGLLPCPSALVLMLSAINLDRIGYGLILTIAFSFGLAATLTVIGLLFLYGGKMIGNSSLNNNRLVKTLPVASAFIIACLGAIICYNSLV